MDAKTLALYLGCHAMRGNQKIVVCGLNINSGYIQNIVNEETIPINEIKLLLRTLSSMTEDEGLEVFGSEWDSDSPNARDVVNHVEPDEDLRLTPNETKTLLSKGFDLFGLIEKGEAIDSTTLTPTT